MCDVEVCGVVPSGRSRFKPSLFPARLSPSASSRRIARSGLRRLPPHSIRFDLNSDFARVCSPMIRRPTLPPTRPNPISAALVLPPLSFALDEHSSPPSSSPTSSCTTESTRTVLGRRCLVWMSPRSARESWHLLVSLTGSFGLGGTIRRMRTLR